MLARKAPSDSATIYVSYPFVYHDERKTSCPHVKFFLSCVPRKKYAKPARKHQESANSPPPTHPSPALPHLCGIRCIVVLFLAGHVDPGLLILLDVGGPAHQLVVVLYPAASQGDREATLTLFCCSSTASIEFETRISGGGDSVPTVVFHQPWCFISARTSSCRTCLDALLYASIGATYEQHARRA